jgi:hypothetical protein
MRKVLGENRGKLSWGKMENPRNCRSFLRIAIDGTVACYHSSRYAVSFAILSRMFESVSDDARHI